MSTSKDEVPTTSNLRKPVLRALEELDGRGTTSEIRELVIEYVDLSDEVVSIKHKEGTSRTELDYRLGWTRTKLKNKGLIKKDENDSGVWCLVKGSKYISCGPESTGLVRLLYQDPNLVLQGPPGTGKTYEALQFAASQANEHLDGDEEKLTEDNWRDEMEDYQFSTLEDEISELDDEVEQKEKWREQPVVWEIVQLHPEYAYEDFVRGMATQGGKGIEFAPEDQTFVKMAEVARIRGDKPTILILDEINRANLPSLLGELIYALEADKRGDKVRLQYEAPDENDEEWLDSDDALEVPENLWVLGTMNTADRSIAMVDYAIRRRFRFMEMQPDGGALEDYYEDTDKPGSDVAELLDNINELIVDDVEDRLGVGHSYLMVDPEEFEEYTAWRRALRDRLEYEVGPLLKEYALEGHLREDWEWGDDEQDNMRAFARTKLSEVGLEGGGSR